MALSSVFTVVVVTIWFGMKWWEVVFAVVFGVFLSIICIQYCHNYLLTCSRTGAGSAWCRVSPVHLPQLALMTQRRIIIPGSHAD